MLINDIQKIYIQNIIKESNGFGNPNTYGNIPRPNRMKTPQNYYGSTGSTGRNAREYDLYIQDEAEDVFIDKYGNEKGHKAWQGIIGVGNAMWKACDEILGQRLSMADDNSNSLHNLNLQSQCTDYDGDPSWIVNWVWWILFNIINGKKYTDNFISECIPTFQGVKQYFPVTTSVLLQKAGIDVDNYKLTKKVQAKRDAEKAAADAKLKAEQEKRKAQQEKQNKLNSIKQELEQAINNIPHRSQVMFNGDNIYRVLSLIKNGEYNPDVGMVNLINLPEPTNKDEQRIYDIVLKSNNFGKPSVFGLNTWKARNLAYDMNKKITGEPKRNARKLAAEKYGLPGIAVLFKK